MAGCEEEVAELVEWLGDTGASRHVCNDLSLMRDVRTRHKPIVLRQLVGDIQVYKTGTVQLDCPNNSRGSTTVSLLDTCYIPEAKVNLFSLQKLRKSLHITEQGENLGTQWVRNSQGDYIGNEGGLGGESRDRLYHLAARLCSLPSRNGGGWGGGMERTSRGGEGGRKGDGIGGSTRCKGDA